MNSARQPDQEPLAAALGPPGLAQFVAGAALMVAVLGCAGGQSSIALPPQTVTPGAGDSAPPDLIKELPPDLGVGTSSSPEAEPPTTPDPVESPRATPKSANDRSLIILGADERAPGETTNRDLVLASQRERERRRTTAPVAIIDDENLSQQAQGGNLTVGSPSRVDPERLESARRTLDEFSDKEEYWRTRAREIRQRFRDAFDSIDELEDEATEWRRRFYESEDKAQRDREIKPAWDRARDLVTAARETLETARDELDLLHEEGRYAGALDGWLREGIELEPWPEELEAAAARRGESFDDSEEPPPRVR